MIRILAACGVLVAGAADAQTVKPEIRTTQRGAMTDHTVVGAGSWGEVYGAYLKALEETAPAEAPADVDVLSPPLLLAMARRVAVRDPAEGVRLGWLAVHRMTWDGFQCRDRTAPQGRTIVLMHLQSADPEFLKRLDDPALKLPAWRRIRDEEAVFTAKTSPWWLCSHGIQAAMTGMEGGALKEGDWRVPPEELAPQRARFEAMIESALKAGD